jgi:hypothetical protein
MFLKTNRRIAALISVICLALLVFCLVERAVRKAIAPAVELAGLYVGRRPSRPAGWCSRPWPGCGSTPPAGMIPRPTDTGAVAGQAAGAAQRRPHPPRWAS